MTDKPDRPASIAHLARTFVADLARFSPIQIAIAGLGGAVILVILILVVLLATTLG